MTSSARTEPGRLPAGRVRRRAAAGLLAAAAGLVIGVLAAGAAQAAAYRYWTYWSSTGTSWVFAQQGPAYRVPADGTAEGWRFGVSTGTTSGLVPRQPASTAFAEVCGSTPAQDGRKRVAVVVDYGVPADAPDGQSPPGALRGSCVVAPPAWTGAQVLSAAAAVRTGPGGLVCGLDGYPSGECAVVVGTTPTAAATTSPPRASSSPRRATPDPTTTGPSASGRATASTTKPSGATGTPPGTSAAPTGSSSSGAPTGVDAGASSTPTTSDSSSSSDQPQAEPSVSLSLGAAPVAASSTLAGPLTAAVVVVLAGGLGTAAWWRSRGRRQ
ncbi:MAG: hypothetical protein EPO13_00585 [Actinomycetota bacterium]|nr:MAG: hypothetical protein EPO13_00585 [Actinomycetota bacterium]